MNCNEARPLLDAHVDGELDPVRDQEVAAHLRTCSACAEQTKSVRACRAALAEQLPRFTAPPQLANSIRAAINVRTSSADVPVRSRKVTFPLWQFASVAASIAVAVCLGFTLGVRREHTHLLVAEAVSDHIRSLQASHLTDVTSTDQHTVKPWFAGKLDFSPPVVDLVAENFPLIGGRLEEIDHHPAAALVFRRRQHAINLFIWPTGTNALPAHATQQRGYSTTAWRESGFNFLAVSEIPLPELRRFAESFRTAIVEKR